MPLDTGDLGHLIWLVFSICAILIAWQFALVPTLQDCFRIKVFGIRRRLFLYMADGNIEPTHPAYTRLRSAMNGILRFTERLSFVRVAIMGTLMRAQLKEGEGKRDAALATLAPEVRKVMVEIERELGKTIALQLFVVSPTLWIGFVVLVIAAIIYAIIHGLHAAAEGLANSINQKLIELIRTEERELGPRSAIVPHRAFVSI